MKIKILNMYIYLENALHNVLTHNVCKLRLPRSVELFTLPYPVGQCRRIMYTFDTLCLVLSYCKHSQKKDVYENNTPMSQ